MPIRLFELGTSATAFAVRLKGQKQAALQATSIGKSEKTHRSAMAHTRQGGMLRPDLFDLPCDDLVDNFGNNIIQQTHIPNAYNYFSNFASVWTEKNYSD